jgi:hypothetical protein
MTNFPRLPVKHDPNMLVLDSNNPMQSADRLVEMMFTVNGRRVLHRRPGRWVLNGRDVSREQIITAVWRFLHQAKRRTRNGDLVGFYPNTGKISNVMSALRAVCFVDELPVK